MKQEREEYITDEHLEFLDKLRESGVTNMFGATSYILAEFPDLSKEEARRVLTYWMETFGDRQNEKESISIVQVIDTVEAGANVTGLNIDNL